MPAQKKHTNCVLCGVSLAAYPRHRTYTPSKMESLWRMSREETLQQALA